MFCGISLYYIIIFLYDNNGCVPTNGRNYQSIICLVEISQSHTKVQLVTKHFCCKNSFLDKTPLITISNGRPKRGLRGQRTLCGRPGHGFPLVFPFIQCHVLNLSCFGGRKTRKRFGPKFSGMDCAKPSACRCCRGPTG